MRLALLSALAIAALAALPARAQETPSIRVTGTGEVAAPPDTGYLTAGVSTEASTAGDAVRSNGAAMERVLAALGAAGIEKKDIQTSGFSVHPVYADAREPRGRPQITGYGVTNQVSVRVRGVEKVGSVLDQLVAAGANEVGGVSFSVGTPEPLLDEARKRALADARRKAELYAASAGLRLGRLLSLEEGGPAMPGPMPRMARMEASVPIESGEVALAISVVATYAIEP